MGGVFHAAVPLFQCLGPFDYHFFRYERPYHLVGPARRSGEWMLKIRDAQQIVYIAVLVYHSSMS